MLCMPDKDVEVDAVLSTSHERRHINYLVVATRRSGLVTKVSGRMHSDKG